MLVIDKTVRGPRKKWHGLKPENHFFASDSIRFQRMLRFFTVIKAITPPHFVAADLKMGRSDFSRLKVCLH